MSDHSIALSGVTVAFLLALALRYWCDDRIERDAHGLKLSGDELTEWIKRRTG